MATFEPSVKSLSKKNPFVFFEFLLDPYLKSHLISTPSKLEKPTFGKKFSKETILKKAILISFLLRQKGYFNEANELENNIDKLLKK